MILSVLQPRDSCAIAAACYYLSLLQRTIGRRIGHFAMEHLLTSGPQVHLIQGSIACTPCSLSMCKVNDKLISEPTRLCYFNNAAASILLLQVSILSAAGGGTLAILNHILAWRQQHGVYSASVVRMLR